MDIKDVENLAELGRIELSSDEKQELLSDMGSILEYVKQIESVKIEDTKQEYDLYNVWREDLLAGAGERTFSPGLIKDQFPDSQDGFLKVKKIL